MKKSHRTQLNTRVKDTFSEALKAIDEQLEFSQRQIVEDAIALFFGAKDPLAEQRRDLIQAAFKKGTIPKPFSQPWPPSISNAARA